MATVTIPPMGEARFSFPEMIAAIQVGIQAAQPPSKPLQDRALDAAATAANAFVVDQLGHGIPGIGALPADMGQDPIQAQRVRKYILTDSDLEQVDQQVERLAAATFGERAGTKIGLRLGQPKQKLAFHGMRGVRSTGTLGITPEDAMLLIGRRKDLIPKDQRILEDTYGLSGLSEEAKDRIAKNFSEFRIARVFHEHRNWFGNAVSGLSILSGITLLVAAAFIAAPYTIPAIGIGAAFVIFGALLYLIFQKNHEHILDEQGLKAIRRATPDDSEFVQKATDILHVLQAKRSRNREKRMDLIRELVLDDLRRSCYKNLDRPII